MGNHKSLSETELDNLGLFEWLERGCKVNDLSKPRDPHKGKQPYHSSRLGSREPKAVKKL